MKNILIDLKKEIDLYYYELRQECESLPTFYENLELIVSLDIPDDILEAWYSSNKRTITIINEKLDKIAQQ